MFPSMVRGDIPKRMPPYVAQEQGPPERHQPDVPGVPESFVFPGAVEGAPQGQG